MYALADQVVPFIEKTMEIRRVDLTAGGKSLDPKWHIPGRCTIAITI